MLTSIIAALLGPLNAAAYSIGTHAYLTREILKTYSSQGNSPQIGEEVWDLVIDGSRREDDHPRYLNHFYDPVNRSGLNDPFLGRWVAAPEWALDSVAQKKPIYRTAALIASTLSAARQKDLGLLTHETDFAWSEAIRNYVDGNTQKAMFILGHVLHLIEDMGVPDHTRNDPHATDSPYETWASRFTLDNADPGLSNNPVRSIEFPALGEYFTSLAEYSNKNFYSADTINDIYPDPSPSGFEKSGNFMLATHQSGGEKIILYKQPESKGLLGKNVIIFDSPEILEGYWKRLAPEIVSHGAGVINLFFGEVERAKLEPRSAVKGEPSLVAQVFGLLSRPLSTPTVTDQPEDALVVFRKIFPKKILAPTQKPVQEIIHEDPPPASVPVVTDRVVTSTQIVVPETPALFSNVPTGSSGGTPQIAAASVPPDQTPALAPVFEPPPPPIEEEIKQPPLILGPVAVSYIATTSRSELRWEPAVHTNGSTSTISYSIHFLEDASATQIYSGTSSLPQSYLHYERDRNYRYLFAAEDEEGNIATTTLTAAASGILGDGEVYFYKDNRPESSNKYLVDVRPLKFPFIPPEVTGGTGRVEQGIIIYLNREPNELNTTLASDDPTGIFRIGPWDTLSWSFWSDPEQPPEDMRFVTEGGPVSLFENLTASDYITFAYYTYDPESRSLRPAAYSKKKFYLSAEPPGQLPPLPITECNCGFNVSNNRLYLYMGWHPTTDPDSPDAGLRYEWNASPGSSINPSLWKSYTWGFAPNGAYQDYFLDGPGVYTVGIRAVDEFGAHSEPFVATFDVR